jgi:hypothetical protein
MACGDCCWWCRWWRSRDATATCSRLARASRPWPAAARLSPERLADFVLEAKGAQLNNETADFITNVWVDYSLFAQAIAKDQVLTDSATVAQAMWPQITELKATLWHDSLMARRINVTPDAVSQAYNGTDVRIFQHVLIRSGATATPEEKAAAKKQAQKAIAAVKGGAPFSQVAAQASGDPGSARDGGYLPPGPRGQFVPQFDSVAWALAPGEMTGPVETTFGIHVIRRPPLIEVQDRLDAYLRQREVGLLDSLYMDSLAAQRKLKIESRRARADEGRDQQPGQEQQVHQAARDV